MLFKAERIRDDKAQQVVCTPFDRTGSLVALSTEAKKFSWREEFQA